MYILRPTKIFTTGICSEKINRIFRKFCRLLTITYFIFNGIMEADIHLMSVKESFADVQ